MIIYKVTNLRNEKVYVGKTSYSLDVRKSNHLREALRYNSETHFHRALRKWGHDNFVWEVVEEAEEEQLDSLERKWIESEDSFRNGYNQTMGGDGQRGWVPSEETRKIWSRQRKGSNQYTNGFQHPAKITLTPEEKETRRLETNKKISQALKGREPWNKGKKAWQKNKEVATQKGQNSRIESGYVWTIEAYEMDGTLIKTFNSQNECAKHFGICPKTLRKKIDKKPHKGIMFKKCHSARACRTWAKGGPITEDTISYDWQERGESAE